jgi:tetratricopeptide (TPR) repeat protein
VFPISLLLVLGAAAASPAAVRVYARVEVETAIYSGDSFTYSVVVEGGSKPSKIDISPLAAFQPRHAGSGLSTQTVGDRTTVSFSDNFVIAAGPPGVMRLPGVTVVVDGQNYTTNPVEVTISRPGTTDRMSLECEISDPTRSPDAQRPFGPGADKQCYVGQPLVMTVRWIVTARVQQAAFDVPVFKSDDFYIEDSSESTIALAREQATIHGVPVTLTEKRQLIRGVEAAVLSFQKVLIPKRSGRITLEPITVSTNMAVGRERTGDLFNPFQLRFQRVSVQSERVELDVRPLPETGRPPAFYGLIGAYTISASAAPTEVSVGDPITLTIRIGGSPYLKPVQWPALEEVPELAAGFKIPAEKAAPVVEGDSKVFTQTIRANSDSVTQVPAIPLACFDPAQGRYVVAKTEPIPLKVAPSKVLTNVDVQGLASAPVNREVEAIRKGLSANYYGPEVLENQSLSVLAILSRPAYAAMWSIPLLGLIVSVVVTLAGRTSPEALARKRRRGAAGVALAQLKKVSSAEPGQRHELLLAALKSYLGDRFDKVAASLTADDCYRILVEATGDAVTAGKCKALIDLCEAARYGRVAGVPPARIEGVPPSNRGPEALDTRGRDARDTIEPDQVQQAIDLIQLVERQKPVVHKSYSSHRSYLFLALCLSLAPGAKAAPTLGREQLHALLQEANTAFQTANAAGAPEAAQPLYEKAILLYEKIITQGGIQNAKLYYNLANAYLLRGLGRVGDGRGNPLSLPAVDGQAQGPAPTPAAAPSDLGRAILNYRRAAKLDSADLNIRKNLAFARSQRVDRIETSTEKRVLETLFFWHYDLSLRTKLLLACLCFAGLCVALIVRLWAGGLWNSGWGKTREANPQSEMLSSRTSIRDRNPQWPVVVAVLSAGLWLALLASILVQTRQERRIHAGVITVAEIVARQGDGPNYPPSFKEPLHGGMEFELLERRPGWLHIRLSDGADTWIPDGTADLV